MTPAEFKTIRLALGLTQVELASFLGYRHGMRVSVFERGAEPIPYQTAMLMKLLSDRSWSPPGWKQIAGKDHRLDTIGRVRAA